MIEPSDTGAVRTTYPALGLCLMCTLGAVRFVPVVVCGAQMPASSTRSDRERLRLIQQAASRLARAPRADLVAVVESLRLGGRPGEDALVETFGVVCEAWRRVVGRGPAAALVGTGLTLQRGMVVSVGSGDDAAVVASFAAAAWVLDGGGVHLVVGPAEPPETQAGRIAPVLRQLGMTVAVVPASVPGMPDRAARRAVYEASVTVADYRELGYDYLGDHLVVDRDEVVQRGQRCAIVLDADAVLLDNRFTPLQITAPDADADDRAERVARAAAAFDRADAHRTGGESSATPGALDAPASDTEPVEGFHAHVAWVVQAMRRYQRGTDYIIRDGRLVPLDQNGRPLTDRRFQPYLHQAIEAREKLPLSPVRATIAEISVQALFRRYQRLAAIRPHPTDATADPAPYADLYRLPAQGREQDGTTGIGTRTRPMIALRHADNASTVAPPIDGARLLDRRRMRYLQIVDQHRNEIYTMRQAILHGVRPARHTEKILFELIDMYVRRHCPADAPTEAWDLRALCAELADLYPTTLKPSTLAATATDNSSVTATCLGDARRAYAKRVATLGDDTFAELERRVTLHVIDTHWPRHLANITRLQQTLDDHDNHLTEYQRRATASYQAMCEALNRQVTQYLFRAKIDT
jgi:preprotein translocase subunit SecA